MTDNRVPAGVPTGGQFAATTRAEADVALTDQQAAQKKINQGLRDLYQMRKPMDEVGDTLDNMSIAYEVRNEFPDAATVRVEPYDDGNGPDAYWIIKDSDGSVLDERIASFRPDQLDPSMTDPDADGYEFDVQQALDTDIDAEIERVRSALPRTAPAVDSPNALRPLLNRALIHRSFTPEAKQRAEQTVNQVLKTLDEAGVLAEAEKRESERQQHIARAQAFGLRSGMSTAPCSHCGGAQTPHFYERDKMTCMVCFR